MRGFFDILALALSVMVDLNDKGTDQRAAAMPGHRIQRLVRAVNSVSIRTYAILDDEWLCGRQTPAPACP